MTARQSRDRKRRAFINATLVCVGSGLIFGFSWYFFRDSDLRSARTSLVGASFGSYVGFAVLPHLAPKTYRSRPGVCAAIAAVSTGVISAAYGLSPGLSILLTLAAGLLGYAAPWWVKHVQL